MEGGYSSGNFMGTFDVIATKLPLSEGQIDLGERHVRTYDAKQKSWKNRQ